MLTSYQLMKCRINSSNIFTVSEKPEIVKEESANCTMHQHEDIEVEGWPPSKNRSMPLYIRPDEDSFLLKPEIDLNDVRIIVIVHSGDIMARRRQANRDSWIKTSYASCPGECYKEVKVIFHIGASQNETIMKQIQDEAKLYKDILQVTDYRPKQLPK